MKWILYYQMEFDYWLTGGPSVESFVIAFRTKEGRNEFSFSLLLPAAPSVGSGSVNMFGVLGLLLGLGDELCVRRADTGDDCHIDPLVKDSPWLSPIGSWATLSTSSADFFLITVVRILYTYITKLCGNIRQPIAKQQKETSAHIFKRNTAL